MHPTERSPRHPAVMLTQRLPWPVVMLLLVVMLAPPANAQDDGGATPAPTDTPRPEVPEFVFDWEEEPLYPAGIAFELILDRPLSEIDSLTLRLDVAGEQNPRVVPFETLQAAVTRSEAFTVIEYLWPAPVDEPLPFQPEMDYTWQVSTTAGESADVPGVTAFRHPSIDWQQAEAVDGALQFFVPAQTRINPLLDALPAVYDLVEANTGRRPSLQLAINTTGDGLLGCEPGTTLEAAVADVSAECSADAINATLEELGYTYVELPQGGAVTLRREVIGRLVDAAYAPFWDDDRVPAWFQAGLTDFYRSGDRLFQLQLVRNAARVGNLYALDAMQEVRTNDQLWSAQAYVMTLYMAHRFGTEALYTLARPEPDAALFPGRYETITEEPLDALLPGLHNWVFSAAAARDARLALYAGPTDVPTATPTVSPFPDTETPTPTFTPSHTPTITPTGFLTSTPIPTLTPSDTPLPPTPTITPLPAGVEFETVVPDEPEAQPTESGVPSGEAGIDTATLGTLIIAGGLILGALGLVFILRGRR